MEWHGYVLRARAVAVGSGEDAAVPNMGLEVMSIGVVDHGAWDAITVDWRGRCRSVYGGLQLVRLTTAHLI